MLPGEQIIALPETGEVRIGGGLHLASSHIIATKGGLLQQAPGGKLWVEGRQKRYIPAEEEPVIATILERHAENFVVDIGGPFNALLPQLSFEGATRRNRPNLAIGDVVYARVVSANRDMDPVLSCVDAAGRSAGFGQLKGGLLTNCSTAFARALLSQPTHPALAELGAALQFEVAVGLNGCFWVNSASPATTVFVCNVIAQSADESAEQTQLRIKRLLSQVQ